MWRGSMSMQTSILAESALTDLASKLGQVFEALAVLLAVLALLAFLAGRATGRFQRPVTIVVFLGPALLLLLVGLVIPAIRTAYLSLRSDDSSSFVGVKNYAWAFGNSTIQHVLLNTVEWIVIAPLVATALGLSIALLVDRLKNQA